jgi:hypothetical protein
VDSNISASQMLPITKAQFFFSGRNYCWYDNAGKAPGYWCGYAE